MLPVPALIATCATPFSEFRLTSPADVLIESSPASMLDPGVWVNPPAVSWAAKVEERIPEIPSTVPNTVARLLNRRTSDCPKFDSAANVPIEFRKPISEIDPFASAARLLTVSPVNKVPSVARISSMAPPVSRWRTSRSRLKVLKLSATEIFPA